MIGREAMVRRYGSIFFITSMIAMLQQQFAVAIFVVASHHGPYPREELVVLPAQITRPGIRYAGQMRGVAH